MTMFSDSYSPIIIEIFLFPSLHFMQMARIKGQGHRVPPPLTLLALNAFSISFIVPEGR